MNFNIRFSLMCLFVIIFCLPVYSQIFDNPSPVVKTSSWEDVVKREVDIHEFMKQKQKIMEDTPLFLGVYETFWGSMSQVEIMGDQMTPHVFPFQFDSVEYQKDQKKYSGVGNIKVNERGVSNPSLSRFTSLHFYSGLISNSQETIPEHIYQGYIESFSENLVTEYVGLGTWLFEPSSSNQEKVAYEVGLFTVGNNLTPEEYVKKDLENQANYNGVGLVAFYLVPQGDAKPYVSSKLELVNIHLDMASKLAHISYTIHDNMREIPSIPMDISEKGIITLDNPLPDGGKIQLRAQFYGATGEELGGSFVVFNNQEIIQGAFALKK